MRNRYWEAEVYRLRGVLLLKHPVMQPGGGGSLLPAGPRRGPSPAGQVAGAARRVMIAKHLQLSTRLLSLPLRPWWSCGAGCVHRNWGTARRQRYRARNLQRYQMVYATDALCEYWAEATDSARQPWPRLDLGQPMRDVPERLPLDCRNIVSHYK